MLEGNIHPSMAFNELLLLCVDSSNATLRPCYSLQQLSNGNGLLINKTSIALRLMSGMHKLPKDCTLLLSDIKEVEISPWNQGITSDRICRNI